MEETIKESTIDEAGGSGVIQNRMPLAEVVSENDQFHYLRGKSFIGIATYLNNFKLLISNCLYYLIEMLQEVINNQVADRLRFQTGANNGRNSAADNNAINIITEMRTIFPIKSVAEFVKLHAKLQEPQFVFKVVSV